MNDQLKQRLAECLDTTQVSKLMDPLNVANLLRDCHTALEEQEAALASYWSFIMGMHYDEVGHLDAWPSYAKWKEIISATAYAALLERLQKAEAELNTLLFAVARKFPGETRFQTALRYIEEAEKDSTEATDAAKESK